MNPRTLVCALLAIYLIACAGCGIPARSMSAEEFARRAKIETSPYDKVDYINSQKMGKYMGLNDEARYYRRTIRHKQDHSVVAHQLYAEVEYMGGRWIFYERASDNSARALSVHVLDRDVWVMGPRSTRYTEIVAIDLPSDCLGLHRTDGFSVRVSNKNGRGSIILEVFPNYIEGHLRAIAQSDARSEESVRLSQSRSLPPGLVNHDSTALGSR